MGVFTRFILPLSQPVIFIDFIKQKGAGANVTNPRVNQCLLWTVSMYDEYGYLLLWKTENCLNFRLLTDLEQRTLTWHRHCLLPSLCILYKDFNHFGGSGLGVFLGFRCRSGGYVIVLLFLLAVLLLFELTYAFLFLLFQSPLFLPFSLLFLSLFFFMLLFLSLFLFLLLFFPLFHLSSFFLSLFFFSLLFLPLFSLFLLSF